MDYIGISQTIGRVIRLGGESKTFGLVCVPVYDKVGISTSRKVQSVVDVVFGEGQPAISVVKKMKNIEAYCETAFLCMNATLKKWGAKITIAPSPNFLSDGVRHWCVQCHGSD